MSETAADPTLIEQVERLFQPGGQGSRWYGVHAKPRCEKKAASACSDRQIRHYLPLRRSTPKPRKGQRRYSFDVPLLPGYLFACCDVAERQALLSSGYLVQTIEVVDQTLLLNELRQIYMASSGPTDLTIYPSSNGVGRSALYAVPCVAWRAKYRRARTFFAWCSIYPFSVQQ